jgi:hypothetical protein
MIYDCVDESKVCGIESDRREGLWDGTSAMELSSRSIFEIGVTPLKCDTLAE